jgi:predicted transposase
LSLIGASHRCGSPHASAAGGSAELPLRIDVGAHLCSASVYEADCATEAATDPTQADALRRTLQAANAACDFISGVAWDTRTFGTFALQKVCYQDVRETFGLSAQMTVRALAKVGDA